MGGDNPSDALVLSHFGKANSSKTAFQMLVQEKGSQPPSNFVYNQSMPFLLHRGSWDHKCTSTCHESGPAYPSSRVNFTTFKTKTSRSWQLGAVVHGVENVDRETFFSLSQNTRTWWGHPMKLIGGRFRTDGPKYPSSWAQIE